MLKFFSVKEDPNSGEFLFTFHCIIIIILNESIFELSILLGNLNIWLFFQWLIFFPQATDWWGVGLIKFAAGSGSLPFLLHGKDSNVNL